MYFLSLRGSSRLEVSSILLYLFLIILIKICIFKREYNVKKLYNFCRIRKHSTQYICISDPSNHWWLFHKSLIHLKMNDFQFTYQTIVHWLNVTPPTIGSEVNIISPIFWWVFICTLLNILDKKLIRDFLDILVVTVKKL